MNYPSAQDASSRRGKVGLISTLLVLACSLATMVSLVREPNRSTRGDPRATLLVSEALIHHGTVKLDSYPVESLARYGSAIQPKNNHQYYYFPIGTSLLSVPAVAVSNAFGYRMLDDETPVQMALALLACVLQGWLLFCIARMFLADWTALTLASLCLFGSSLISTGATALWSHDFAAVFASLSIWLALKPLRRDARVANFWLATALFIAYLCRPTLSLLAPFVVIMLFVSGQRMAALKSSLWLAMWLAAFAVWSLLEFGQWLPDYYLPSRLAGSDFPTAAWNNLFGPSRGLFIYSSFIGVALVFALTRWRRTTSDWAILLVALLWPTCHWLLISRFPHWWAGWSFGPRLMTDVIPGLSLLLFQAVSLTTSLIARWLLAGLLLVTGIFSIWVNSYQGLFNPWTIEWSAAPNIDDYPEYLVDWRWPQFLHNEQRHTARLSLFDRTLVLPADSADAAFSGWSEPDHGIRWIQDGPAAVTFPLESLDAIEPHLLLGIVAAERQQMEISLNDTVIYSGNIRGLHATLDLALDQGKFVVGANRVELRRQTPSAGLGKPKLGLRYVAIVLKQ